MAEMPGANRTQLSAGDRMPRQHRPAQLQGIDDSEHIELRTGTEIVSLDGGNHLEQVTWRDKTTGKTETRNIRHVFMMTGAVPNTGWLERCVVLDDKGFIKTGPDLSRDDLSAAGWSLSRPPYLLETSRPGVFAVGDVHGHADELQAIQRLIRSLICSDRAAI